MSNNLFYNKFLEYYNKSNEYKTLYEKNLKTAKEYYLKYLKETSDYFKNPPDNDVATIIENVTKKYEEVPIVDIRYPKVIALKNKEIEDKINKDILEVVYSIIDLQKVDNNVEELIANYDVTLNKKSVISILFDDFVYWKKAIHGLTIIKSLTSDLETGKKYELKDLFIENSNYKEKINNIIKKQIKDHEIERYLLREFETINENQDFYLTENCLVIYYQLYEYTSYAYGFPKFCIDYDDLLDILDPNGPIPRLLYD